MQSQASQALARKSLQSRPALTRKIESGSGT